MIHIQGIPEVAARLAAARKAESPATWKKRGKASILRGKKRSAHTQSAPAAKTKAA
jgi:hypothetical protein